MKLEEVLEKLAEKPEDNELEGVVSEGVYPEKAPKALKPAFHNTKAVWEGAKDGRDGLIDRILDQFGPSAEADKKFIRERFTAENGTPGNYTAHSPLLNHRVTEKKASLREQVAALRGPKAI